MRTAILIVVLAWVCGLVSSSNSKESCVDQTMRRAISDRTCGEISSNEADIASMAITGCLLKRFQKTPGCLDSGSKNCLKSLTSKVYGSYRAVRSKWLILCEGAQQAIVLLRLREAVRDSEELLKHLRVVAEDVEKSAVKSVESGLRTEEAVDGMGGTVDDLVGEVERNREFIDNEISKIADRMDERVKRINSKAEETCENTRRVTRREIRDGGVIASGYGCLGGIIVGCGKRWYGVLGGLLFLVAVVCELLGTYVWPARLGLLSYCGWLLRCLDVHSDRTMERESEEADDVNDDDDDEESEDCDCCFDDDLDAH